MKIIEKLHIPATTRDVLKEIACDVCDARVKHPHSSDDWGDGYEHKEVVVKLTTWVSYNGEWSDDPKVIKAHICPKCFKEVVLQALSAVGVNPKEEYE